jgi:hypothetical protein
MMPPEMTPVMKKAAEEEVATGSLPGFRFEEERQRLRLSFRATDFVLRCGLSKQDRLALEAGELPCVETLHRFAISGADIHYILTGIRSAPLPFDDLGYVRQPDTLDTIFGTHVQYMTPAQLLGALLCIQRDGAPYALNANPYPPRAPHHYGVQLGWLLAEKKMEDDRNRRAGQREDGARRCSMKMLPIRFDATRDEFALIIQIVDRACRMDLLDDDATSLRMDLDVTHSNGCPLDLQKLLDAPDFDFQHDIIGIQRHLDREDLSPTGGQLLNCWRPRCALPKGCTATQEVAS